MYTSIVGFVDCSGNLDKLQKILDKANFEDNYSIHIDNCEEKELWVEIDQEKAIIDLLHVKEFLRDEEAKEALNIDYFIFY